MVNEQEKVTKSMCGRGERNINKGIDNHNKTNANQESRRNYDSLGGRGIFGHKEEILGGVMSP